MHILCLWVPIYVGSREIFESEKISKYLRPNLANSLILIFANYSEKYPSLLQIEKGFSQSDRPSLYHRRADLIDFATYAVPKSIVQIDNNHLYRISLAN